MIEAMCLDGAVDLSGALVLTRPFSDICSVECGNISFILGAKIKLEYGTYFIFHSAIDI